MLKRSFSFVAITLLLSALMLSCRQTSGPPQSSANARRYDLTGTVVSVDRAHKQVVVSHDPIPGFMDAMIMPFTLYADWAFDVLSPGDRIHATLVVDGDRSWLENPLVVRQEGAPAQTPSRASLQPGVEVPPFMLTNQDGKRINFADLRGRAVVLTFIYTRCPLPDYCPLMTSNFAAINQRLQADAELARRVKLLSITVDPEHDTPPVMRAYAMERAGVKDFRQWEFLTGSPDEVHRVATFFGLDYFAEGNQIIHNLRTALISPEGKIVKIYHGNEWKPEDVVDDLRATLGEKQAKS